jgi:hypothetical protein
VPRAVFFDLEPGVIDAARAPPLGELFRLGKIVNRNAGAYSPCALPASYFHDFSLPDS